MTTYILTSFPRKSENLKVDSYKADNLGQLTNMVFMKRFILCDPYDINWANKLSSSSKRRISTKTRILYFLK